jgi:hypothetical protein
MSVILLVLGLVVAAAGIATIGFGIPINEFTLGTTLIIAGSTALTGGLILIGLSAVVTELGRLAEGLKARPAARAAVRPAEAAEPATPAAPAIVAAPPMATAPAMAAPAIAPPPAAATATRLPPMAAPVPPRPRSEPPVREARPPEPHPAAPSAVEVSAAAIERLRSSIPRTERPRPEAAGVAEVDEAPLSPNGAVQPPAPRPVSVELPPPDPRVTAEDRGGGSAVEALRASRLDFLFRSKAARPAPQPEQFETYARTDSQAGRNVDTEPPPRADQRVDQMERHADVAPPPVARRAEPAAAPEPRTAAILKSGVVDGMAYTLYADGSIEAKLPHGTVRFGSIAELRAHIESNS